MQPTVHVEHSVEIETTPERVFAVLTDPRNVSQFAGGIEGAEVMDRPGEGYAGATLEVVTKGGNILKARVTRADHGCIEVEDERGVRARWETREIAKGRVRIRYTVRGPLDPRRADSLRYDADVKFQGLRHLLEDDGVGGSG